MSDNADTQLVAMTHDSAGTALNDWRPGDRSNIGPLRMAAEFAYDYERLLVDTDVLAYLDEREH